MPQTSRTSRTNLARDSERRFRRIASFAPIGIFETDADTNCSFVNDRWCELAGMSADQAMGQGWSAALHPDDRERVISEWNAATREGREYACEYRFVGKGRVTWLRGNAVALRNERGTITGYLGTITAIGERKVVEGALLEAEARLEAVLASIGDHLVCFDREWRYTYVNDTAAKFMGKSKDELLGRSLWELFPDAEGDRYHKELEQAFAEQRVIRSEHHYEPQDRWFENFIYPSLTGVTVFATDVTWRRRLEHELRQRNERLAEADRHKDNFLAVLAHELRNPLAPVRNALEVMKMSSADPVTVAKMREVAERQLEHVARLLDDLLDVSRISRGSIELRPESVDVAAVVQRTVEALQPAIDGRRHTVELALPADTLRIEADPTRMEQVLMNLLSNAVKYTPEMGRIVITVQRDDQSVLIRVKDSGIGIAPPMLPKIFELFVQGERRLEHGHGGVGIGLTLVKQLVELHGGTVQAGSEGLGKGSEFVVRLPMVGDELPKLADSKHKRTPPAGSPELRVLVVDDNRDAADSLALLLELAGHKARPTYGGTEALDLARTFAPDILLLDLGMPGMDGYDVARELRRDEATEKIVLVALTGWGQTEDRVRSAEAGFAHHLTKPVAFDAVRRLLAEIAAGA